MASGQATRQQESTDRMYMEMGCPGDVISMTCSTEGTSNITISKAAFGWSFFGCSGSCCVPNLWADCYEDVQVFHPEVFQNLQDTCNGKSTCEFKFSRNTTMDDLCSGRFVD